MAVANDNVNVIVTPLSGGWTTVTVTATDSGGLSATQAFDLAVTNRGPVAVGMLDAVVLQVGEGAEVVDVAGIFEDPDGEALTYGASSSVPAVVGAAISGTRVTLTPAAGGTARITVTAIDVTGSNMQARLGFDVRVKAAPGVTVSTDALTVTEGSTATYTVVLDSEPTGDVVVTATAEVGAEVTVSPAALTFTAMNWGTAQTVTVAGMQDSDAVADPPFTISHEVSGSDYDSVSASSVQVTIVETGTSTLSVVAARAGEMSSVMFEVTLSKSSSSEITVEYATSDGSGSGGARAGSDYTETMGTLTFPANSTASQQIVVPITNDREDEEEEETFLLTLTNPQNAELVGGEQTLQAVGTIEDDDVPLVEVSFGSSSYVVTEGRTVDVVVRLNRDPERDLKIGILDLSLFGASRADYWVSQNAVAFGAGVMSQQFQVSATDDRHDDDGEKVQLELGSLPFLVDAAGVTTVSINGDDGDEDTPPRAGITVDVECAGTLCRASTGTPVLFEDTSTGSVRSRRWDFGDGTGSRNQRIDHVWAESGFYEVTLSVSDGGVQESTASLTFLVEAAQPAGTCVADDQTRCLQDSRYAVTVDWWTADSSGQGNVVYAGTNDSGLFTFFDRNNWEVLIKVLDGCALNDHVWVFGASTTDLGYAIRVTDTVTGTAKQYRNERGTPAPAITDTTAFAEGCRQ